jgi:sugar O-acyltransferase (sialic acid O-acetyltransferase NeuD family)
MKVIIFGTGGLAREFSKFFSKEIDIIGFSSNDKSEFDKFSLPGKFFENEISPEKVGTKQAVLAIANPQTKKKLSKKLKNIGFEFPNLIHSSVLMGTNIENTKSEGVIISPNCLIAPNVFFGNFIYINFMVGIGHDVRLKDYIQINPGAQISGDVSIEECVMIGSGSIIRQGLEVKSSSTIGSGSIVLTSVAKETTVIGNPARPLKIS